MHPVFKQTGNHIPYGLPQDHKGFCNDCFNKAASFVDLLCKKANSLLSFLYKVLKPSEMHLIPRYDL
jgi:hypothetical protein